MNLPEILDTVAPQPPPAVPLEQDALLRTFRGLDDRGRKVLEGVALPLAENRQS